MVTDLDHSSRSKFESNTWLSYFLTGYLIWTPASSTVAITWDKAGTTTLKTTYGHSGRGMELSELVTFDGRLLAFDDRSGIVFVIEKDRAYPWVLLSDGDGRTSKGFKSEWATVKDKHLYVGSMGKEWTTSSGEFVNTNPMWVKVVNQWGEITHVDWTEKYKALRQKLGIEFPGYMLHESGVWSDVHRRWFFLPRRMSKLNYDENEDERRGTNVLLTADEDFRDIKVVYVGEVLPTHGFSSFKFIPGTNDEVIVALKTSEVEGSTATYVMAFTIRGQILMGETKVGDFKYEGLEFI
ncbi:hypothetical protein AAG570_005820 [Ranatra chinensis]|uniref:Apyrase n=1 Tax=Ranatra chinensis TaxID=642074 RepID=A0ABD0Y080_9HEMI